MIEVKLDVVCADCRSPLTAVSDHREAPTFKTELVRVKVCEPCISRRVRKAIDMVIKGAVSAAVDEPDAEAIRTESVNAAAALREARSATCKHFDGTTEIGDGTDCATCHVREWASEQLTRVRAAGE